MAFKQHKRFIAGAVCPHCAAMDTLVMYKDSGKDFRECVSCGFIDEMRFKTHSRELETRVNVTKEEKQQEIQVLDFKPRSE